ncbi:salicylate synthase [Nocardia mangyaensis]|uniref:salicylate synthase n=1 Tax=Nocardia mangyaensis TaxID=2213200 RepID=UPI0026750FFC|nr:salicylate synthase [Nocardia mangyaensis]MDO3646582.1 salicylate synthase [Nocardia mangyaensis]
MSITDERSQAGYVTDPVAAVAGLAGADLFGEYVVYERPGEWVFAADPIGTVELGVEELRVEWDGRASTHRWTGRPASALDQALRTLPLDGRNAYGWIGFEFCAWALDATAHVAAHTALAHLMVPRIEVRIAMSGIRISGATPAETRAIHDLVTATQDTALPLPHPTDVRSDRTGYRERVAEAGAEIRDGRYRKVILSRKVELPFMVDVPATYRLGRAHNTPARSFLLRLGGLAAAGFSPELVVSVDDDRVITTRPVAGTRRFGRSPAADLAARTDLLGDPKEIAEHAMSVHTSFTEISAIAAPGTPAIVDFMTVRERGSVQHLTSTVRGLLIADRTSWDALEALFPAVTAAGIPKRDGVDAIFRLDRDPRGLYSGAVVTVTPSGSLEATLVLRAVYQTIHGAWLRAGAGIIEQSTPEREFEETCEKLESIAPYVVAASPSVATGRPTLG